MDNILLSIYILSFVLPFGSSMIMLYKYTKLWTFYCFDVPASWWNAEEEKPRLFFFGIGLLFSFATTTLKLGTSKWQWLLFAFFALLANFLHSLIWTNKFKEALTLLIKRKLTQGKKSPLYNDKLKLTDILKELNTIECSEGTFKDFLLGYRVEDKIKCTLNKRQLIRFVIVIFGYTHTTAHKEIKEKINHYFVNSHGSPYTIQEKASEISAIFSEILNEDEIFTSQRNNILSLFSAQ